MQRATRVTPRLAAMACRARRGAVRLLGSAVLTSATLIAALLAQEIIGARAVAADAGLLARAWQRFDAALSAHAAVTGVPPREPAGAQSKPVPATAVKPQPAPAAANPQPAAPPPSAQSPQSPPQAAAQVRRTPTGGYEYIPPVVCSNGSCIGGAVAREPVISVAAPRPAPSAAATPVQPLARPLPQPGTVPPREPAPRAPAASPPPATPAPAPPPPAATPAPAPLPASTAVTATAAPVLAPTTVQPTVPVPPPQAGGSAPVPAATPAPKTVVPAATTVIIHAGEQANPVAGKAISEVTPVVRGQSLRVFQAAVGTDAVEEQSTRRRARANAGATSAETTAATTGPKGRTPAFANGRDSTRAARSAVALQTSAKAYRQASSVQWPAPAPVLIAMVGGRGIGQTADLGRGSPSYGAAPDVFNTGHHVVAPAGCASRLIVKSAYFRKDSFGKPLTIACR